MRNTGKSSEEIFEDFFADRKDAYLERRTDLSDVRGLNPSIKGLKYPAQPSDYILTFRGATWYVEVKSSSNKTSFPFSQFEKAQWNAMTRVTAAGGHYLVYIHNVNTDVWYILTGKKILDLSSIGRKSVKWSDLDQAKFN